MTTEIAAITLNSKEARRLTDEVKADAISLWLKLKQLYDGQAHLALGYASWGAYFTAEFGQTGARGYQLLEAARVRELLAESTMVDSLNERQARELAPLADDPEALRSAWQEAVEQYGEPTAADIRQAIRTRETDDGADVDALWSTAPDAAELPPLSTRQPIEDFLQALADAPRCGLLSYPPSLVAEATDEDCATIQARLADIRTWLDDWEQALSLGVAAAEGELLPVAVYLRAMDAALAGLFRYRPEQLARERTEKEQRALTARLSKLGTQLDRWQLALGRTAPARVPGGKPTLEGWRELRSFLVEGLLPALEQGQAAAAQAKTLRRLIEWIAA